VVSVVTGGRLRQSETRLVLPVLYLTLHFEIYDPSMLDEGEQVLTTIEGLALYA
jgi:hypothetical protein